LAEFAFARTTRRSRTPLLTGVLFPGLMIRTRFPVFRTRADVGGHLQLRHLLAKKTLDVSKAALILFIHEGHRGSRPIRTRCTANAVYVVFHVGRRIVVDNKAYALHVDPS